MSRRRLSDAEIDTRVETLPGFRHEGGKLVSEFEFASFVEAFGWMARVALVAERMDHHPDWHNVYSRVVVGLHTHDQGGVTELDFELARRMNELSGR